MSDKKSKYEKKVAIIKQTDVKKDGLKTRFYVEVDDIIVFNTMCETQEEVEKIFQLIVENKGVFEIKDVIKEEYI